ncbi:copper-transporting ATPase RAN1 [Apiospora arundinis]
MYAWIGAAAGTMPTTWTWPSTETKTRTKGYSSKSKQKPFESSKPSRNEKETSHGDGDGDGTKRKLPKKPKQKRHRGQKGAKKPFTTTTKKAVLTPVKLWASELKEWRQNHGTKGKKTVVDGERGYLKYHKLDDDDSRE